MAPKVESLAEYLRDLRLAAGLTLRDVEEQSENTVSNGYLSQLESGQAKRPAPNVLHALAKVYGASYQRLMELAGYLGKSERTDKVPRHALPTLATKDLTAEEEKKMLEYLGFLRSQRKRK
jgi:transcriptional regulator with XRE-family HTH domain